MIAVWIEIEGGFTTIFLKYLYIDLLVEIISQVQGCVSRSKVLLETALVTVRELLQPRGA